MRRKAEREDLRRLCEQIIASQAAEIEQMQTWFSDWYGIDHEPMMSDPAHHPQMMQLGALEGREFEIAFLQMMVQHDAMAVVDPVECLRKAAHWELRQLCGTIGSSQLREIILMQVWLCCWYGEWDFRRPMAA